MKILVVLAFLIPITVVAQTKADYQTAMAKFQRFYNSGQGDSIHAMFNPSVQTALAARPMWTKESNAEMLKEYGTLTSFNFLGIDKADPSNVYVFQTNFSKAGAKTTSLTLNQNAQLGTFRFITTSEGIVELLNKRNH